jgi:transcriptional regulator with XRE-family HTH domain
MNFAEKLKSERERLGLTQAGVAPLLDVSAEWVSKVERNLSTPRPIAQEGAIARLRKIKQRPKAKGQNHSE